jgi:hypothetical protein
VLKRDADAKSRRIGFHVLADVSKALQMTTKVTRLAVFLVVALSQSISVHPNDQSLNTSLIQECVVFARRTSWINIRIASMTLITFSYVPEK